MKTKRISYLIATILVFGVLLGAVGPAYAVQSARDQCSSNGGRWEGDSSDPDNTGTCYYDNDQNCPDNDYYAEDWVSGQPACGSCGDYDSRTPYTDHRQIVRGSEEAGVISYAGWEITYPAGGCLERCAMNVRNLPNAALKALGDLDGMVSNMYYMTDSGKSYTVCYYGNADALFRFSGGEWVQMSTTNYGDRICATASGHGAFAATSE